MEEIMLMAHRAQDRLWAGERVSKQTSYITVKITKKKKTDLTENKLFY